jgi:hypothetical protein
MAAKKHKRHNRKPKRKRVQKTEEVPSARREGFTSPAILFFGLLWFLNSGI